MRRASVVATAVAVAVSTVAVLALGACSGQGSATAPRVGQVPEALAVQAYAVPSTATTTAFGASRDAIDVLSVSGVSILPGGATVGTASDDAKALLAEAQEAGVRAELLVLNADPGSGDFSGDLAMSMLGDEGARTAVVAALADQVEADGWDGVQLDLESLPGEAAPLLTQFAVELRDALPDDAELSMALQPSTTVEGFEGLGYDLRGLQEVVDRFVLMAYDEHGAGFSEAGPVGGLPWVEEVLDALLEVLPAEVVDLGVAQYGYQWIGSSEAGSSLTVAQARRAAASTGSWDDEQGEYTASPADGTTLWWSDSRSLTLRADLAEERGLHGVAVWQLSTGDRFER